MPRTLQLFDVGLGRGHLFGPGVLDQYLREHQTTAIHDAPGRAQHLRHWLDSLEGTTATEKSLKTRFINDILCGFFGYTTYPVPPGREATLYPEPPTRITGISRSPDAVFGQFMDAEVQFSAAVELKSPGTDLDLPQPGYGNETPVQQGFYYGDHILGVRWVIVSDMRIIRLYSVESQGEYEEIEFGECVDVSGMPTENLRRLHFLLHHDYLVRDHASSQVALLYAKSAARRLEIRESFYSAYYTIRSDLFEAIRTASGSLSPVPTRPELLEATQRLLDRLLFIYYCEDHPQRFIKDGIVAGITEAANRLPGASTTKVYEFLKALFREVDAGSPPGSGLRVAGYNGELFKDHRVIDHIELPDALHQKVYTFDEPSAGTVATRRINGVWGLHVYDFWTELNEHMLGHIFEESLSDLEDLGTGHERPVAEKLEERKRDGIFYTTSILSDFMSASAVRAILNDLAPVAGNSESDLLASIESRLLCLANLRIVDFACGSGAFLVSIYRELVQEFWRLRSSQAAIQARAGTGAFDLIGAMETSYQASLLRDCIFGVDKLPQATEIAKLALWLRSARKDQKVLDLSKNILAADSLDVPGVLAKLGANPGSFDLVIGNPPWGGVVHDQSYGQALNDLGIATDGPRWDSWELFLVLGLRALREGGRLALVLPDSFLYPQKARLRKLLFDTTTPEKVHNLGPDWFGHRVRMGTVIIQARRGPLDLNAKVLCAILAGDLRGQAIAGEVPLTQIESQKGRRIPASRPVQSPTYELEVFRGIKDDQIIADIIRRSTRLHDICERARGEEMNKGGLYWICPSCLSPTTPGGKKKGGGYKDKPCPQCNHGLSETTVGTGEIVTEDRQSGVVYAPFVDGDDINRRYRRVPLNKWLRVDLSGWEYKPTELYRPPKLLVRQAGVGVVATLDETEARCPQSIYIYRLRPDFTAQGYQHEFILAALLSRVMAYIVFKRFAEIDPDKAHAKLTHERLADLPIPKVDFSDRSQRQAHDLIVENARTLLNGAAEVGSQEDRDIEQALRSLWKIGPEDGAFINGEFYDLPDSQVLRDLFPNGRPRPPVRLASA